MLNDFKAYGDTVEEDLTRQRCSEENSFREKALQVYCSKHAWRLRSKHGRFHSCHPVGDKTCERR